MSDTVISFSTIESAIIEASDKARQIKCSNCCNWSRLNDYFGECVTRMGLKVEIAVLDDGEVKLVETKDDFFCASFSPLSILW